MIQKLKPLAWCIAVFSAIFMTGCSSSQSGGVSGVTGTPSTALTIDNAGTIPVFANSSTQSVVYVHNNTPQPINDISYTVVSNTSGGASPFTVSNNCQSIAANSECALEFSTPILSPAVAQGSATVSASYQTQSQKHYFTQMLNYSVIPVMANGVYTSSNAQINNYGNPTGYATVYLYGSGDNQNYQITQLSLNSGDFSLSAMNFGGVGTAIASKQVQAVEIMNSVKYPGSVKYPTQTTLNVQATDLKTNAVSAAMANIMTTAVNSGAILTVGEVPIVNVSASESGQMLVLNSGNTAATITAITPPAGLTLSSGSNQCSSTDGSNTLAGGASCTIYFSVSQAGGNGNITLNYTGGSSAATIPLSQTVTWYNPVGGALLQMTAMPEVLSFPSGGSESTLVTMTNIGGYDLSGVTITPPATSGSSTESVSALTCSGGGTALPVNGSCSYTVVVSDSITETNQYINLGISGTYISTDGTATYSRVLVVGYSSDPPPVTVTMSSTLPASTTSASVTTPVMVIFSAAINPSTVTNNSFYVESSGGLAAGTVGVGSDYESATFTPSAAMAFNTQYTVYATESITDSYGNPIIPLTSNNTFTTLLGYGMFVTSSPRQGQFTESSVDAVCQTEAEELPVGGTWKAMIAFIDRQAAPTLINWVLQPNAPYFNENDSSLLATTTSAAIFDAPLAGGITKIDGSDPELVWSGLNTDWTASESTTCNNWTSKTSPTEGNIGRPIPESSNWWSIGTNYCSSINNWVCVQQP